MATHPLGLLVTRPLWIPQVWRGDGPQVDSVSVFIIIIIPGYYDFDRIYEI